MQILLADFDNDGDLDLFLLDGPKFSNSTQGLLYRNNGSGGFTDVSVGSGLADVAASDYGNIIADDSDNAGQQDLLVAGVSMWEARRGGKERRRPGRSRGWPRHEKKKK